MGAVYEINQIHEDVFTRIPEVSYPADINQYGGLRYLKVPYYGFDGQTHEELIVKSKGLQKIQ